MSVIYDNPEKNPGPILQHISTPKLCKVVFLNQDFPISMTRQKVGLQWRKYCSSLEMYTSCTVLVLPTHVFGQAILQTSKIHNLFIQYPNYTYFSALESS
jgi:hypothetical protein